MHWLQKLQRLYTLWSPETSRYPLRVTVRQLSSIPWGHQDVPEKFNFASNVIDHWAGMEKAGKRPPGPALWWVSGDGDQVQWNFRELSEVSQQAANVLSGACRLQRGDRVAVVLPRVPEWWLVTLGCFRAGLVFMPGTVQMKSRDILYRLQVSKARAIVAGDEVAQEVDAVASDCPSLRIKLLVSEKSRDGWLDFRTLMREAPTTHRCVETRSQEAAAIYFTSGTSGPPKMAEHSHSSLGIKAQMDAGTWTGMRASDIIWTVSDPGWILNLLTSVLEPWTLGACVFIHLLPKFDPQTILKVLSSYPINNLVAAPLVYRMLLQQDLSRHKFPHLQNCFTGGETLLPETLENWRAQTGLDIWEFYGQTETGLICRVSRTMNIKPGRLGTALPHYDVQVIDGEGHVLPPGQEGDMAIRVRPTKPVGMFLGYVDNLQKTAANIRGDFWLLGDRGIKDEDGYFQFVGRADDIINSSGYRIGPSEVENALLEHPAVAESAVISSPDPDRGEVVKALVVLAPEFLSHDRDQLTQELQQHVKSVTAPYKYPRKVSLPAPGERGREPGLSVQNPSLVVTREAAQEKPTTIHRGLETRLSLGPTPSGETMSDVLVRTRASQPRPVPHRPCPGPCWDIRGSTALGCRWQTVKFSSLAHTRGRSRRGCPIPLIPGARTARSGVSLAHLGLLLYQPHFWTPSPLGAPRSARHPPLLSGLANPRGKRAWMSPRAPAEAQG